MTAAVVGALVAPLLRRRAGGPGRAAYDRNVYREQLRELTADRERGTITAEQEEAARIEIERRILAAGEDAPDETGPGRPRLAALAVTVLVPVAAFGLYAVLGSPDLPDQPMAGRVIETESPGMPSEIAEVIERLAARLKENPNDLPGWTLLARSYAVGGRYDKAASAYREAAALAPDDNDIAVGLGESIVFSADGMVTPAARAQFEAVLARDPTYAEARYYMGLARAQAGDREEALSIWTALARDADADTPWLPELDQQLRALADEMGEPAPDIARAAPEVSPVPRPSAEDMAAAAQASPEERMEMIRSMVDRLNARLIDNPDDLEGWKRLANAKRVLGEMPAARDAYAKAVELAPDDADALAGYASAEIAIAGEGAPAPEAALDAYERLLALDPGHFEALWFTGLGAVEQGRVDDAAAAWRRLADMMPPDSDERAELLGQIEALGAAAHE
jgi:cytochrome c-type biogenesis protein CcmH